LTTSAILISIAIVILAVAIGWFLYQRQRRRALQARFGPEYSHAIREYGDESHAADALARRERRMEKIHIRSLSREDQRRFLDQWEEVQRGFVDDPPDSIRRADALVCDVMRARGYPMSEFEHRAEDLSVDHPEVVQNFRVAHSIAQRHEKGQAGTEDLRKAMVFYRDLFDELLEAHPAGERRGNR
jgi:hypothetical protein